MQHTSRILLTVLACGALALPSCARSAPRATLTSGVPAPEQRVADPEPVRKTPQGTLVASGHATSIVAEATTGDPLLEGTYGDVMPPLVVPLAGDRFQRVRLLQLAGKYPLCRREEVVERTAGGLSVIDAREMVADHLVVSLDPGHPTSFAAIAAATGVSIRRTVPGGTLALLAFPYTAHGDYQAIQRRLAALQGVRVAESDWVVHAIGSPDDSAFTQLWGMHNTGQTGGTADADIDAPEAWAISTGSTSVLVGVIDTGIDATHPDLAANMWTNPGESGAKANNGIDDDGNGYIDDAHGWDFVNEDNNPADDHYHGTHCAGTIGGVGNNGQGVAGVCWHVSLVGLKFLSAYGSGYISDAVEAQLYANAVGCDLTSNSWGGGGFSQALKDAIDAAGAKGALFVAAAGNNSSDNDSYPNYPSNIDSPNVIAVAATDHNDALAYFSCYGATTVDLAAPGVSVYSCQPGGLYQLLSGTSMATPHVAGACALLKSANPSLSGAQIKAALLAQVDQIPAMTGKCVTGGRLNIHKALLAVALPQITASTVAIAEDGNGDGLLNPGEDAVLTITLANIGPQAAEDLSAVLSSSDPTVTIVSASAIYGDVASGGSSIGDATYRIRLAAGTATPYQVALTLTASALVGGPWDIPCTVTYVHSTQISGTVTRTLTGAPVPHAIVSWSGTTSGSTLTAENGSYLANVPDGTFLVSASAAGLNASVPVQATVPPAVQLDIALGAAELVVSPLTVDLSSDDPTATVTVSNPGDAPLAYTVHIPNTVTTSGLWHASSYRTATGSGTSWYYGSEATRTYDTGAANHGALVFPEVVVPASDPTLRCSSWRKTEGGSVWDASLVQVSTDGALTWATLCSQPAIAIPRRDGLPTYAPAIAPGASWSTLFQDTDANGAWHPLSINLAAYSGQTVALRFWFDTFDGINNSFEGWYVDAISLGGAPLDQWLQATPLSGTVVAGGSTTLQLSADLAGVPLGISNTSLLIASDAPVDGSATVAVSCTKTAPAELLLATLTLDDGGDPADGDGDGAAEPGESIALLATWSNLGTFTAGDAVTTIACSSPYAAIVSGSAILPDVPGLGQATALSPFVLSIAADCQDGTPITVIITASLATGGSWSASRTILVHWSSRLTGVVRTGLGDPLAGATVTIGGLNAISGADGSYQIAGIPAGTATAVATKSGSLPTSTTITTPPAATWDPVIGTPRIAFYPSSVAISALPGGTGTASVSVSNPGDAPMTWSASTNGTSAAATGMWHQSSYRTIDGRSCWYYGDENKRNYDTGYNSNSGNLTIASVIVPVGSPTLAWQQWRQVDPYNYGYYDQSLVQVSTDGTNWTTLHQTQLNDSAWHTVSVSLAAYAGQTVQIRFRFDTVYYYDNNYEGWYVGDIRLNGSTLGSSWLSAAPSTGTIAAGASMTVAITADTTNLTGLVNDGALTFSTNAPSQPRMDLPVTCTTIVPAVLVAGTPTIIDSGAAPISGDGDGKAEPGETIAWSVPLINRGTTTATGVTATLSSTSAFISFPVNSASYGSIAGLATGTTTTPCIIAVSSACPNATTLPITCTMTSSSGESWTSSLSLLVQWDCRISGRVTAVGTGAGLVGAYVYIYTNSDSRYLYTDAHGAFSCTGLLPGQATINVGMTDYVGQTTTLTLPASSTWNPVLGIRDLTISPTTLTASLSKGGTVSLPIVVTGTGTLATTWNTYGLPTWLNIAPASGSVAPGATVTVTATFIAGSANGIFSASPYVYTDSSRGSTYKPMTATMTVKSATPPTAAPVSATLLEDGAADIQLLGSDADGDALTYTITSPPQHGTITQGANGLVTYLPTPLYHGTDGFVYRVSDGLDQSPTAAVSLTITHVNHAPTAWQTVVNVAPDITTAFDLPVKDVDQDVLTINLSAAPRVGSMTVSGTTASYTPPAGFVGQDVCTIAASDGQATSASVLVIIHVGGDASASAWPTLGNGPEHLGVVPRALGGFTLTPEWTKSFPFPIHPVAIAGGRAFYSSRTYYGTTRAGALDAVTGADQWSHDFTSARTLGPPTYHGDSIYVQRDDNYNESQLWRLEATTGATIWQAPFCGSYDNHLAPTVAGDRAWIQGGSYGGLYGFNRTTGAQVFFQSKAQYDMWAPTFADNVLYTWVGNTLAVHAPASGNLTWSTTLPSGSYYSSQFGAVVSDGQRLYVVASSGYYSQGVLYAVDIVSRSVAWSSQGYYRGMPALQGGKLFVYTANGIDQFNTSTGVSELTYPLPGTTYNSTDLSIQPIVTNDAILGSSYAQTSLFERGNATARATVPYGGHISLAGSRLYIASTYDLRTYRMANRAPTATNRGASTIEGQPVSVTLWGNDPDDELISWRIGTAPAHGSASLVDGTLVYTSADGFGGTDTLTVIASDGSLDSTPATITIQVTPLPTADAVVYTTQKQTAVAVTLHGTSARGDPLTYAIVSQPAHGTLSGDAPALSYLPEPGFLGTDSCTYNVADTVGVSTPATILFHVVSLPPVATGVSAITAMDKPVHVALIGSDPDGDAIAWRIGVAPTHGIAVIVDGEVVYTPLTGFTGRDALSIIASDGQLDSPPATISIDVQPLPTANAMAFATPREVAVSITLRGSSPRGQALTYVIASQASHGVITGTPPMITYLPDPGFVGTDICMFTVADALGVSRPAVVTFTVQPGLPAGWNGQNIGTPLAGSTTQDPNTGDMDGQGAGSGMIGQADSGQFASTNVRGDFDAIGLVPLPASSSAAARVGIAIRETTDPNSRGVFIGLSGTKKAVWTRRIVLSGSAATSTWTVAGATWVKASRRGNVLWCYRSTDGVAWVACGSIVLDMPDAVRVGCLIASGDARVLLPASVEQFRLVRPQSIAGGTISINFQSGLDAPVLRDGTTWQIADGAPFGDRWAGRTFGTTNATMLTRNRNSSPSPDERYDTNLDAAVGNRFEVAVPNGSYTVTVCVGDPTISSGLLAPEIEGVRAVTGSVTRSSRWFTSTVAITVSDGRLTLSNGAGATAARWAWLQIIPAPTAPTGGG